MPAQYTVLYLTNLKQLTIDIAVASSSVHCILEPNKRAHLSVAYNKDGPKRSIYLESEFPKGCVQIHTQMNLSSTSLHSKAVGLTKMFSPATLSILDMSPSIACTMDQCQTHFACGDFLYHEQHNSFLGDDAVHEKNFKKGKYMSGSKGKISETIMAQGCKVAC